MTSECIHGVGLCTGSCSGSSGNSDIAGPKTHVGQKKVYLGDGVYAAHDGFGIWLTAENGIEVVDFIYLELSVYYALTEWVASLRGA